MYFGGIVITNANDKVPKSLRCINLPIPWYVRKSKVEQMFEEGILKFHLTPGTLAFADGHEELAGTKTWLLRNETTVACIVTSTDWVQNRAYKILRKMLEKPSIVSRPSEFLSPDGIERVQQQLDAVKGTLQASAVMDRGEKLEELQIKAEDMSKKARLFYTEAKKVNRCC